MSIEKLFDEIIAKHEALTNKINNGGLDHREFATLSKENANLRNIVEKINEYKNAQGQIKDLEELSKSDDLEMRKMAEEELYATKEKLPILEKNVKIALLPKDEADEKNIILEIRAGTGGDEAALFAAVLMKMYQKYAEKNRWKIEIMDISENGIGGVKECVIAVQGAGVFGKMKFESGTHRVQRVPETENAGRVHTSAATVAVLPEVDDIDIKIDEKDIRVDIFRSSGPGGQSVNTTDSAVRMTHLPTGIVVSQQDEKSQIKNREKAMRILRARVYEHEKEKRDLERASSRKSQIGSGDRSEKIRTYNYPQGRVTDHRINLTLYQLEKVVSEGCIDEFVENLRMADEAERLSELNVA
ncbi:peptide chain release factor 1 [Candidatus Deianiraea vastatrix]|uniref:Peptide chain release factor 1 n=1 Tax=Candidatus Deianiraea vastatrix TaxID=2163644 RepID=A0A5B8XCK3_9RICK|nr:peptide chain release factor 1 [Candidatus Deianiraea vastatrix]QED23072.1 Peptide chain release factor 1 [Candidatus Deianiraea vastatrix]